jgi:hypothetical protein
LSFCSNPCLTPIAGARGAEVLASEAVWVGLPGLVLWLTCKLSR